MGSNYSLQHFTAALNDSRESTFLTKVELRFNIAHCYDIAGDLDRAAIEYRTILTDHSVQLTSSLQAQILRQLGNISSFFVSFSLFCFSSTPFAGNITVSQI